MSNVSNTFIEILNGVSVILTFCIQLAKILHNSETAIFLWHHGLFYIDLIGWMIPNFNQSLIWPSGMSLWTSGIGNCLTYTGQLDSVHKIHRLAQVLLALAKHIMVFA